MNEPALVAVTTIGVGLLGWIIPYRWNPLRFKRVFRRFMSEKTNRLVPRVVGTILILGGIAIAVGSRPLAISVIPPTDRTQLTGSVQFAYIDNEGIVHDTNEIVLEEGITYGWTFLCTEDREYRWKEVFHYPGGDNAENPGPQTFVHEGVDRPEPLKGLHKKYRGVIGTMWTAVKGDVTGTYVFDVTVDGTHYRFTPTFIRSVGE